MVKSYHDWNSQIEAWESDGRVFREPAEPDVPLMEVFAIRFVHFDGNDRTELRGTVTVVDHLGAHTVFSSNQFQTVHLGRFDVLIGGDFSRGDHRPIDAEYDIFIHTDLEDRTHGELYLNTPFMYKMLQNLGEDLTIRRPHHNEVQAYNTGQYSGCVRRLYDRLFRSKLAGPHSALDVLFAVYKDTIIATVRLTLLKSERESDDPRDSVEDVRADVCGKVTARNTMLTDPEAYSTLFAQTNYDRVSLVLGDLVPLSKPSVVVPAASPLLLDLDLECQVSSRQSGSCDNGLKTKSSFRVPASQVFESSVHITSPDVDGPVATLKVEVKWLKFKP